MSEGEGGEVDVGFKATLNGFAESIGKVTEGIESINGPINDVVESAKKLTEAFAVLFAVDMIKESIEKVGEWAESFAEAGEQVEHMAEQTGMSVEEISSLGLAAKESGLTTQGMGMALDRLSRSLAAAQKDTSLQAQAFKALGISSQDVKEHGADLNYMLGRIADSFAKSADGPGKTAIAIQLFGRAGAELIPVLDGGSAGIQELKDRMDELGGTMSEGAAKAAGETHDKFVELGVAWNTAGRVLFEYLEPAIDAVVGWLTRMLEVVEKLGVTWLSNTNPALLTTEELNGKVQDLTKSVAEQTAKVNQLTAAQKAAGDHANVNSGKQILALNAEIRTEQALIDKLNAEAAARKAAKAGEDKKPPLQPPAGATGAKDPTKEFMTQQEEGLKHLEVLANTSKDQRIATEITYWTAALDLTKKGSDEEWAVREKLYDLRKEGDEKATEDAKKAAEDQKKLTHETLTTQLALTKMGFEEQKSNIESEVAAGKISASERVNDLKTIMTAEEQLDEQAIQSAYQAGDQTVLAQQQTADKIKLIQAKLGTDIRALNLKTTQETDQVWKQLGDRISSTFEKMLNGILQGTQSWRQLMSKIFSDLAISFATSVVNKMVQDWLKGETAKAIASKVAASGSLGSWLVSLAGVNTATVASGTVQETTATTTAATQVATNATATGAVATGNAIQAGTGAAASAAPIPYVGWLIALGAGAAVLAGVMAMKGGMKSAAGGMVVPNDMLANIHKDEMVLPANLSKGIQGIISGGQNSDGSGGGDTHVHFNVTAMDGNSVAALFKNNGAALAQTLSVQVRNNNSNLNSSLRQATAS